MKLLAKSAADYLGMKEGIKGYGQWERGKPLHIPVKLNPIAFICYTWQKARKLYWGLKQVFTQAGWKNEITCLNEALRQTLKAPSKVEYSYPGRKKWEIKTRCTWLIYSGILVIFKPQYCYQVLWQKVHNKNVKCVSTTVGQKVKWVTWKSALHHTR